MGKLNTEKTAKIKKTNQKKNSNSSLAESISNTKKSGASHFKLQPIACKKKDISNIIKNEHKFIASLFDILDLAKLNQGKRNDENEEDDNSDSMQLADIPEQKFKKQTQKKSSSQVNVKTKSFPQTIEALEKELEELKGTPMTYQIKLRKKGLQSRLVKKRRKELRKANLKSGKKHNPTTKGLSKTKPILNSDGNVVSNKFDFADTDTKKENKKKGAGNNEVNLNQIVNLPNGYNNQNESRPNNLKHSPVKKENSNSKNNSVGSNDDLKATNKPVFNKDNKMVFSKVYVPENHKKLTKKEFKKGNTKKLLEKIKEENKKISNLEKEDQEKAVVLKEKQKWTAALKRASGEKVKDDPELLRKSIAREKNKKMRSQKKWKARLDHVQKEKDEKQKKRKDNIQARKSEKKKKKMKKAIKKGSYVPL